LANGLDFCALVLLSSSNADSTTAQTEEDDRVSGLTKTEHGRVNVLMLHTNPLFDLSCTCSCHITCSCHVLTPFTSCY